MKRFQLWLDAEGTDEPKWIVSDLEGKETFIVRSDRAEAAEDITARRLAEIEKTHEAATGNWSSADWIHYVTDKHGTVARDEDGEFIMCDEEDNDGCETCRSAKAAAEAAEISAQAALEDARMGDFQGAKDLAQEALGHEEQFGDAPTWREFANACVAAFEDERNDETE